MEQNKYIPCGGCGATNPIDRCIGCFHPFESTPLSEPKTETVTWWNLSEYFTEDWQIMHCRYAKDKCKLDTDLFELNGRWLVKKGGTGRLKLSEVEYMTETPSNLPKEGEPEQVESGSKQEPVIKWMTGEYARLYDQLQANPTKKVPCFVDYDILRNGDPCRDICTIRGEYMEFSARGISYGGIAYSEGDKLVKFLEECERLKVQWLDEGKERGKP
jgi:hypothetical protein